MNLPANISLFVALARLDKPVGIWLLYFPALWGLGYAQSLMPHHDGQIIQYVFFAALFLIGSVCMRSVGCIYNDWCDRDLDKMVARTANRPLANGSIDHKTVAIGVAILLAIAAMCILPLPFFAQMVAVASIIPVAVYPWMKRITYWPQLFLGITFNWGILVGYAAITGRLDSYVWPLYLAAIFWTLAYDTIYALQDIEDDMRIGVKSSAIAIGAKIKPALAGFYAIMGIVLIYVGWDLAYSDLYFAHLFVLFCAVIWQLRAFHPGSPADALRKFKCNIGAGIILASAFFWEAVL